MHDKQADETIKETPNSLFERQKDDISCGPACLASVAKLYGVLDVDYEFFRKLMNPDPAVGSCNIKMAEAASHHLPFDSVGENTYKGGIAIANVLDRGEGHYILLLARKDDDVIYYDPYDHDIRKAPIASLEWVSESGHLRNWAINFAPQPERNFSYWKKFTR